MLPETAGVERTLLSAAFVCGFSFAFGSAFGFELPAFPAEINGSGQECPLYAFARSAPVPL